MVSTLIIASVIIFLFSFKLIVSASWDISGIPQVVLAYGIIFGWVAFLIGYSLRTIIK